MCVIISSSHENTKAQNYVCYIKCIKAGMCLMYFRATPILDTKTET